MLQLVKAMTSLPLFVLVTCRITGMIFVAPIFSSMSLNIRTKIAFVMILTFLMSPFAAQYAGPLPVKMLGFAPLILSEIGLGLLMGLTGAMLLATVEIGGNMAAQQMGLAMAQTAAPDSGVTTTAISIFLGILALLFILAMDVHHWFIEIVAISYREAPIGEINWKPVVMRALMGNFSNIFVFAIRLVAPLMGILFFVNVMIALVAKTAPKMRILMVAYPLKVIVGLAALVITFPLVWPVVREACTTMREQMFQYLRLM